ncbi:MAG: hypothetical protein DRI90_22970 [Deltaproteobacteria bacterium]|nr:MAG: hypothetical protein DRI90_22970 [Deltaproteobacteria bacterium]
MRSSSSSRPAAHQCPATRCSPTRRTTWSTVACSGRCRLLSSHSTASRARPPATSADCGICSSRPTAASRSSIARSSTIWTPTGVTPTTTTGR